MLSAFYKYNDARKTSKNNGNDKYIINISNCATSAHSAAPIMKKIMVLVCFRD